jgi:hypothetical protein
MFPCKNKLMTIEDDHLQTLRRNFKKTCHKHQMFFHHGTNQNFFFKSVSNPNFILIKLK